jgi:hypothetical protein
MTYQIIQPPFTLRFSEMQKRDLQAYRLWIQDVLHRRIAELTSAVKVTPGHEAWEPDETPGSLDALGRWFESQVEMQREELTVRSWSLAMDIGLYFGRVVLRNVGGTWWDQPLDNKKVADYGQPVILGLGPVPLNPVRVMIVSAYTIAKGEPAGLHELFDAWAKMRG